MSGAKVSNNAGMYGAIVQIIANNRELLGLSQSRMADKLGVSRRKYQRMEAGDITLRELCDILELSNQIMIIVSKDHLKVTAKP